MCSVFEQVFERLLGEGARRHLRTRRRVRGARRQLDPGVDTHGVSPGSLDAREEAIRTQAAEFLDQLDAAPRAAY